MCGCYTEGKTKPSRSTKEKEPALKDEQDQPAAQGNRSEVSPSIGSIQEKVNSLN